jgi:predicted metalloenzyme YecM
MFKNIIQNFVNESLKDLSPFLCSHWEIDHVCYRTDSHENYRYIQNIFSEVGILLGETIVGGRPIACFELHQPILTSHGLVSLVEVPAPKPGRHYDSGLEHLEVVVDCTFDAFLEKFPDLEWNTRATNKIFNPEIEAKFSNFNVKFHHHALNHIIELEKSTALDFLPKLQNFAKYSPQIAGTIPLGIAVQGSDLDVLMQAFDFDELAKDILAYFPDAKITSNTEMLTANFHYGALPVEIYAENLVPLEQKAYRHLRIEGRLIKLLGHKFKNNVIKLKQTGLKTEPAFGKILNLSSPYEELLELYWLSDVALLERLNPLFLQGRQNI